MRSASGTAAQCVAHVEAVDQVVLKIACRHHSFSSLARISFMISDVPAPMVFAVAGEQFSPLQVPFDVFLRRHPLWNA
jgi:hypothetical protein